MTVYIGAPIVFPIARIAWTNHPMLITVFNTASTINGKSAWSAAGYLFRVEAAGLRFGMRCVWWWTKFIRESPSVLDKHHCQLAPVRRVNPHRHDANEHAMPFVCLNVDIRLRSTRVLPPSLREKGCLPNNCPAAFSLAATLNRTHPGRISAAVNDVLLHYKCTAFACPFAARACINNNYGSFSVGTSTFIIRIIWIICACWCSVRFGLQRLTLSTRKRHDLCQCFHGNE
jgi:hypothetical protein